MICNDLPKSYLIKQKRDRLNDICHVTSLPGDFQGAQLTFTDLLKERINHLIATDKDTDWSTKPIQIKISGDGARMTKNTSFILLSFSLLQTGNAMSAGGNHTIAIVKGSENYDTIKNAFQDSFMEINNLIAQKQITIGDARFSLDFFSWGRL